MSNTIEVRLPDIGEYTDIPIIEILARPGDRVAVDDLLLSLESDKATLEVPSPAAGVIREWKVVVGTRVSQGTPLLILETQTQDAPEPKRLQPVGAAPKPTPPTETAPTPAASPALTAPTVATQQASALVHASPSVRALGRELGARLSDVPASGPKGRILRQDVTRFVKGQLAAPAGAPRTPAAGSTVGLGLPAWPSIDHGKYGRVEREPLSRIAKLSGGNLTRNWLTIPHVTNFDKADVTELEGFRREVNGDTDGAKLTMVAFLIKTSALALKAFPRFNASLDGEELVLKSYVHVGFAADTPKGLMVPVIRDCDQKGLLEIAREMRDLAEKARAGTLPGADMQGGCFSVSSLGSVGGTGFTPIINAPEVAILGAGRSDMQAVWNGHAFEPRLVLPLSLSWDHRIVDGVAAARFLGHIASTLSDLRRAVL